MKLYCILNRSTGINDKTKKYHLVGFYELLHKKLFT